MKIDNLLRQHREIYKDLDKIKKLVSNSDFKNYYTEFSRDLSLLSGKLQIHLNTEDKFLYPALLNKEDLKEKTQKYIIEIKNLLNDFTEYKNKFNTKSKLMNYDETFIKKETIYMIKQIESRMIKEEGDIYELC
ncbi:hemerythrin domain-containing protein [Clostridium butyricum]|uniref:hemerythrin domain-containing protein n=1 Tax=Clostridium butyricum TaxID=1492 RepID=UPI001BA559C8|nr:hemerythrin domain-containing protein [Clostridium butyricum]QUF84965.1 hemerythrin domain-containing protein [Clostridium butyricum]